MTSQKINRGFHKFLLMDGNFAIIVFEKVTYINLPNNAHFYF